MKNVDLSMFRKLSLFLTAVIFLSGLAIAKDLEGLNSGGKNQALSKTSAVQIPLTMLNINNISSFFRADGQGNHDRTDQAGLYFPKGTSTAIYEDGFVWGGKLYTNAGLTTSPSVKTRVGGQTYNQGTRQGWVTGWDASAVAAPPADPKAKAWRIRRDYTKMTDGEIIADASSLNGVLAAEVTQAQKDAIISSYAYDWTNWPVNLGAPYIERNGTPGYQAPPAFSSTFTVDDLIKGNYDEPGIAGADPNSPADQVIWTVYNDLDPSATQNLYMCDPIGLEGQVTMWGYKRTDAMGNLYFKRLRLINKGGVDIGGGTKGSFYVDSMYISQWSDPDVGDSGDDLAGCDTLLSLGFAYNGNAVDLNYKVFNLAPPAVGYDFLQGPAVPSTGSTAIVNMQTVANKKNLPMTGFVYFSAGSPISDPALGSQAGASYESTLRWYRMLRGLRPDASSIPERFYPFPPGTKPGPYALSGNPVTQTGFVDGLGTDFSLPPGDRRIILTSGPFRLVPRDTQEVVVGTVAGIGSDRMSSVTVMKFNDQFVQNTYDALFVVPKSPSPPKVSYTELDGQVVFEWGSDQAAVSATENTTSQPGTYTFEGYNVYQLPSKGSSLKDAKRVATYDLQSDPTIVLDLQVDDATGQILSKPVQFGSNSGISRYFIFNKDYVKDIPRLNNGSEYFIAITAYSVTRSGYLPASLESSPEVYTVYPQQPKPGVRFGSTPAQSGQITHIGTADAYTNLRTIDPAQLAGASYTMGFSTVADKFLLYNNDQESDANGNTYLPWELIGNASLDKTGKILTYSVKITNRDSLGTISGAVLQTSTGTVLKNIIFKDTLINGVKDGWVSGTWTSTDPTQPLTDLIVTNYLMKENLQLYFVVKGNIWGYTDLATTFTISTYPWYIKRGTTTLVDYQQDYSYTPTMVVPDYSYPIVNGFQFRIGGLTFVTPIAFNSWSQTVKANSKTGSFTLQGDYTIFGGVVTAHAADNAGGTGTGGKVGINDYQQDLELRFTGVRASNAKEDTIIVSGGSIASVWNSGQTIGVRMRIPFELWEADANGRTRQINCVIRDRNADAASPWGSSGKPLYLRLCGGGRCYVEAVASPYDGDTAVAKLLTYKSQPYGTWLFVPKYSPATNHWDAGDVLHIDIANPIQPGVDFYTWTTTAPSSSVDSAKNDVGNVGVFPNPYYAFNPREISRTTRFITFNRLPKNATIKIFNLAGHLVRTLQKTSDSQFFDWDLANGNNYPVASGIYLAHIDMPDLGKTKVLKIAIIQEQEVPNNY
jgi:hypothetical protein